MGCFACRISLHFGECAKELHDLIPPSIFHHRDTRTLHRHVVDITPCRTNQFGSSFLMRTAKKWNALFVSMFPDRHNLDVLKTRVNSLFLARHAPSCTRSSLNFRRDRGQMAVDNWWWKQCRDSSRLLFLVRGRFTNKQSSLLATLCSKILIRRLHATEPTRVVSSENRLKHCLD